MKKIHFFLFLLIECFAPRFVKAQCVDSDDPQLNILRTPLGSTVKIWDWRNKNNYIAYLYNKDNPGTPIVSTIPCPFDREGSVDKNTEYLRVMQDFQPEDGWELVLKNFGTPSAGITVPHFILYNRYESMLRVLFYRKDLKVGNSAKIQIQFRQPVDERDLKESALLTHLEAPAKALDAFSKKLETSAVNFIDVDGNFWLHADFIVAYDPCTCNHYTQLQISPTLLDIEKVTLDINGGTVPLANSGRVADEQSGLSTTINALTAQVEEVTKKGEAWGKSLSGGDNFGNAQGDGDIYFPNGHSFGSTMVKPLQSDVILWSNNLIKVKVPSYGREEGTFLPYGNEKSYAGSGYVQIKKNGQTTRISSTNELTVKWAN